MKSIPKPDSCETVRSGPRPNDDASPNIFPSHVALAPRSRRRFEPEDEARPHVALASCIVAVSSSALSAIGVLLGGGGIWLALLVFVIAQMAIFGICILLCIAVDMRRNARSNRSDSTQFSFEKDVKIRNYHVDKIQYK